MTIINFLGWAILLTPVALLFVVAVKSSGLVDALVIYVGVMVLVLTLYVGATLAGFQ